MAKHLSFEEAQKRLPNQKDTVIDFEGGKFKIQTEDGFVYYKLVNKLHQGDPRKKCGYVVPIEEVQERLLRLGYELVVESYKNVKSPLQAVHIECGQIRKNRLDQFPVTGCRYCLNNPIENAPETNKFCRRLVSKEKEIIMDLHKSGANSTDISRQINVSPTAIRSFFKRKDITPNIDKFDFSRNCVICGTVFSPKMSDGVKKDKYKVCSKECLSAFLKNIKTKYTEDQINQIIGILEDSDNKKSIPYIAKELNINKKSICRILNLKGRKDLIGKGYSSGETEVIDFIKECIPNIEIEQNTRQIIKPREIDIFIPSLGLGIEYNGLYWHNEESLGPKTNRYHYSKTKEAEANGVRLITIFEDEWIDRTKQVKNFLKSVLGVHTNKAFARQCQLQEVPKDIAKKFLNDYHIQGHSTFIVAFGLYHNDELVGLVTGNKHHRDLNSTQDLVLNRLVFKDGWSIVGGSSRLLNRLVQFAKDKGYNRIISWSDNRWSQGNVYKQMGFILDNELDPDYSYVTPSNTRESKQSNQKTSLLKKGAVGTMLNTERELAKSLNYKRIWDCGKKKWIFTVN